MILCLCSRALHSIRIDAIHMHQIRYLINFQLKQCIDGGVPFSANSMQYSSDYAFNTAPYSEHDATDVCQTRNGEVDVNTYDVCANAAKHPSQNESPNMHSAQCTYWKLMCHIVISKYVAVMLWKCMSVCVFVSVVGQIVDKANRARSVALHTQCLKYVWMFE